MNIFPSSYYKTNKNGEKYEEPIFIELKIFHDIIGAHYNYIIMQDVRNKVVFGHTETKSPALFNTQKMPFVPK